MSGLSNFRGEKTASSLPMAALILVIPCSWTTSVTVETTGLFPWLLLTECIPEKATLKSKTKHFCKHHHNRRQLQRTFPHDKLKNVEKWQTVEYWWDMMQDQASPASLLCVFKYDVVFIGWLYLVHSPALHFKWTLLKELSAVTTILYGRWRPCKTLHPHTGLH